MKRVGLIRSAYLTLLSQPAKDRIIYQFLYRSPTRSILELGIGSGIRAGRMIELASQHEPGNRVRYIGVDLFEARPACAPGLSLRKAHQWFSTKGARPRLVPGDPHSALQRTANELGPMDLVVISADQEQESLTQAWPFLPRLLHAGSVVFLEDRESVGQPRFQRLSRDAVVARERKKEKQRRRAA